MNSKTAPQLLKEVHHGQNIKRFREMFGIKQDNLADLLNVVQQTVSRYESEEKLDDDVLNKCAKALNIPVDAIKNCNDEIAVNIISNTFNEQSVAYQYNFNPFNKIVELYDEKIALYERLLKAEKDKTILFEKLLKEQEE